MRIWDITSSNEEHLAELSGHNYGISCTVSYDLTVIYSDIYIWFIYLQNNNIKFSITVDVY